MLDKHQCYELCVQSPGHLVGFLRAAHGRGPSVLREDFCGTAALSVQWVREGAICGDRAVGVDLDPQVVAVARERAAAALSPRLLGRLTLEVADCRGERGHRGRTQASLPQGADVVFVGNFSVGYLRTRAELVEYLRLCAARCQRGGHGRGGGVTVCDTYGGASAFATGSTLRKHPGPNGVTIHYHWVHEKCDPLTGMVENSISFRVEHEGEVVVQWPRAFTYKWRLWSIAELREAMAEAGFESSEVFVDVGVTATGAVTPVSDPEELGGDWVVMVVART